jgi:hypothetical protein
MPAEVAGERFYRPSSHGAEPALYAALEARRRNHDDGDPNEAGDDVGR